MGDRVKHEDIKMVLKKGIYTLANDDVYDQLIALINSIRANYDRNIPICIIPYDDKIDKIKSLKLDNVFLFDDPSSFEKWSNFASEVWNHERFLSRKTSAWYHGSNTIRKLCSFDGQFEHFLYIDSDELVMSSLEDCFNKLTEYDCVFDDWEHRKENCFLDTELIIRKYPSRTIQDIKTCCHCSDFFAAKANLLNSEILEQLKIELIHDAEVNFINERGWWDEVYLFSYITFKLNWKLFNYTLSKKPEERTGNIAGADPFVEKDWVLYNKQELKPVHRIHYMGYGSDGFKDLCRGEAIDIPHRDVFLHYRFLAEPEAKPQQLKQANVLVKAMGSLGKNLKKLKKKIANLI